MSGKKEGSKEYLARAQHCLDIAGVVDGARRVVLLEMAQAWTRLADQAERNRRADLVYETPGPRAKSDGHSAPSDSA